MRPTTKSYISFMLLKLIKKKLCVTNLFILNYNQYAYVHLFCKFLKKLWKRIQSHLELSMNDWAFMWKDQLINSEQLEVEEKCIGIVKLLSRLNFTVLSSSNCTIMCPVHWAHVVTETFAKEGASPT